MKRKRNKHEGSVDDIWVEETFTLVCDAIKKKSGIKQINQFLIDAESSEIFVLTVHRDYSKSRLDHELRVTQKLLESFNVYEIEESSPPGSGWIPWFAGAQRKNVMGWQQNKSVLFSTDAKALERANAVRDIFVKTLD